MRRTEAWLAAVGAAVQRFHESPSGEDNIEEQGSTGLYS